MSSLGTRPRRVARCHSVRYGSGVLIPASPSSPAVCPRLWHHPYPSYQHASQLTLACPAAALLSPRPRSGPHPDSIHHLQASTPSWPCSNHPDDTIVASKFSVTPWLRPPSLPPFPLCILYSPCGGRLYWLLSPDPLSLLWTGTCF